MLALYATIKLWKGVVPLYTWQYSTYQLNAPPDYESPLHDVLCELRRWEQLPQRANHRQAPVPLTSRCIVLQNLGGKNDRD